MDGSVSCVGRLIYRDHVVAHHSDTRTAFRPTLHPRIAVTVWDVLDMLASGMTEDEILGDYPYLEKSDFPPPKVVRRRPRPAKCGSHQACVKRLHRHSQTVVPSTIPSCTYGQLSP